MKVASESSQYKAQQKRLDDKRKNLIKGHQKEVKRLDKVYKEDLQKIRLDHDENLYQVRQKGQEELVATVNELEDKLENQKILLQKENVRLQEEQNKLEQQFANKNRDLYLKQGSREAKKIKEASQMAKEIDYKTSEILDKAKTHQANELSQFVVDERLRKMELHNQQQLKMKELSNEFKTQRRAELLKQKEEILSITAGHDRNKERIKIANQNALQSMKNTYKKQLAQEKDQYENLLTEQKKSYKNKIDSVISQNEALLTRVKGLFNQELKTMAKQHASVKKAFEAKGEDPFYSARVISPIIMDKGKYYEISLEVPSWEQKYVQLNSDSRNIDIILTRSFHSTVEDEKGNLNKSRKSEVFNKTFVVNEIVSPNELERKYENGILTFKLQKA